MAHDVSTDEPRIEDDGCRQDDDAALQDDVQRRLSSQVMTPDRHIAIFPVECRQDDARDGSGQQSAQECIPVAKPEHGFAFDFHYTGARQNTLEPPDIVRSSLVGRVVQRLFHTSDESLDPQLVRVDVVQEVSVHRDDAVPT